MLGRPELGEVIYTTRRRIYDIEEQLLSTRHFPSVVVDGTTNSTSPTTGSIITYGGMGITKDLVVGGSLIASNFLFSSHTFESTTESTSTSTGAVIVSGGMGIGKSIIVGGNSTFQTDLLCQGKETVNGKLLCTLSTDSTSPTSGSVIIDGGLGVGKTINVGNSITINGTNNSTSTSTGSLIVKGGIGIAQDVYIGKSLSVSNTSVASPEMFGAIGNGLADDTTALQNCINFAANIQFGYDKKYRITGNVALTIPSNRTIDMNKSTILTNDGISLTNWLNPSGSFISNTTAINCDNVSFITIKNGKFTQIQDVIKCTNCSNIVIENIDFSLYGTGFIFESGATFSSENITVRNVTGNNGRGWAIQVLANGVPNTVYSVKNFSLKDSSFNNFGVFGILLSGIKQSVISNINITFDKTYNTWPCGSNGGGALLVNWVNKRIDTPYWEYSTGTNVVESYMNCHYNTSCTYENVVCRGDSFMALTMTKFNQGFSDTLLNNCQFEKLQMPLPEIPIIPLATEYVQQINLSNCVIDMVEWPIYDIGKIVDHFINCQIGLIKLNGTTGGTSGIYNQCEIVFDTCTFTRNTPALSSSMSEITGQFDGLVSFHKCLFYAPTSQSAFDLRIELASAPVIPSFTTAHFEFEGCTFNGNGNYGLYLHSNYPTIQLDTASFIVSQCVFYNCHAINNEQISNLIISDSQYDGSIVNGVTAFTKCINNIINTTSGTGSVTYGTLGINDGKLLIGGITKFVNDLYLDRNLYPTFMTLNESPEQQNVVFYSTYTISKNANFTSGTNSSIATQGGTVNIVNGYAQFINDDPSWLSYDVDSSIDSGSKIFIRFNYIPNYSIPQTFIGIFNAGTTGSYVNQIYFYHGTDTVIRLSVYDALATPIISAASFGSWIPVGGTSYEILLNIDVLSGSTQLFIDGNQFGSTILSTGWRATGNIIQLGSNNSRANQSNFSINNFIVYSNPPHTSNYTPGYKLGESGYQMTINCKNIFNSQLLVGNTIDSIDASSGALKVVGGVGIGRDLSIGGSVSIGNNLGLHGTNESTSTSTGTLVVTGGIGVGRNLFVGGYLHVDDIVSITNTTNATNASTGVLRISGGVGVSGNIYSNNILATTSTINTTNTLNGALTVTGGSGIGGNLYVGGTVNTDTMLIISNTIDATNLSTGVLRINGGASMAKNVYIGGNANIVGTTTLTNTTSATSSSTGALTVVGGVSIGNNLYINGLINTNTSLTVTNTVDTTSTSTGVLQIRGGAGISKNLYISGLLSISNTTNSTSTSTGMLLISGGVGIAKNTFIGGTVNSLGTYSNLEAFGAVGDGITDDTISINTAITSLGKNKIYGGRKQYYSSSGITNPLGSDFDDNVQIMQPDPYGQSGPILYNSYAFREPIWNTETLYGWYDNLQSNNGLTIMFSGDTTTLGQTINDPAYYINILFDNLAHMDGFTNITTINSGHNGASTVQWDSSYVSGEITSSPDLWIIRWGINDAINPVNTINFATALRSGLSKIRTAYPLSSGVGIILMVENSTSGLTVSNLWCEEVQKVVRRAAYDYQCCFFDTYALWQNSRESANKWMDGTYINPKDNMNAWIISKLYDVIIPPFYQKFHSLSSPQTSSVNYATIPSGVSFYLSGMSITPEYTAAGFSNYNSTGNVCITNDMITIHPGASAQWSFGSSNYGTVPICDSSPQTGCIRLKLTPSYTSIADQYIFTLSAPGYIFLRHSSGNLLLTCNDINNITQVNITLGAWVANRGTEYEFEFNWDWTSGSAKLFINGIQFGSTITNTFTRGSALNFTLGGGPSGGNPIAFFRNIEFFTSVQHVANYTLTYVSNSNINSSYISIGEQSTGSVQISGSGVNITNNLVLKNTPIVQPSNSVFYCTYANTINANYSVGTTSRTATNSGSVIVSNGVAQFPISVNWLYYSSNALIDTGQILSARFIITMLYSGTPTNTVGFFSAGVYGSPANLIQFYHESSTGNLILQVTNTIGSNIVNQSFGNWNPTVWVTYEILVNIDVTNGFNQVFINGVQKGTTNTSTGSRSSGSIPNSIVQIGSNVLNRTYYSAFYMKNFVIYSLAPFTSNYEIGYSLNEYEQQMIINGSSNFSYPVFISNTTNSSTTTSGSLIISGGVGMSGNLNVGGYVGAGNMSHASNASFTFTGANTLTSTMVVSRSGNIINVTFPYTTATGVSATYYTSSSTVQSILAGTNPTTDKIFPIVAIDNNIKILGLAIIRQSGNIEVYSSVTQNNFSGSGVTGFSINTSYSLGA